MYCCFKLISDKSFENTKTFCHNTVSVNKKEDLQLSGFKEFAFSGGNLNLLTW